MGNIQYLYLFLHIYKPTSMPHFQCASHHVKAGCHITVPLPSAVGAARGGPARAPPDPAPPLADGQVPEGRSVSPLRILNVQGNDRICLVPQV